MSETLFSSPDTDKKIIYSDGKSRAKWNWVFALAWNGFVFPIMYFQWHELAKIFREDPIFSVFALFPIIGIVILYNSITDIVEWFKFGEAPLTLNTYPAYIGGNVSGYIDINTQPIRGVEAKVSLRCAHHYIDNSSDNSNSSVDVLWQDDLLMPTQPHADKTRVLFSFQIEDGLPQSQGKGSERHEWNVVVKLPTRGKDLVRSYIISVDKRYEMPTSSNDTPVQKNTAKEPSNVASMSASDSITKPLEHSAQSLIDNKPRFKQDSKSIPQLSKTHQGKRFHYPASRKRSASIFCLLVGLMFGGAAFFMLSNASDFMTLTLHLFSLPFILVSAILTLAGLLMPLHRLDVVIGRFGVTVEHSVLFWSRKFTLKPNEIADIEVSRSGSSSSGSDSTVWYQLKIIDMNGLETTAGDSIAGSSYAKHLRQQMIDALGYGWQPQKVTKQVGKFEKLEKLKSVLRIGWVAKLIPALFALAFVYDVYSMFMR